MQQIITVPVEYGKWVNIPKDSIIIGFLGDQLKIVTRQAVDGPSIRLMAYLVDILTEQSVPDGYSYEMTDGNFALFTKRLG